MEILGIDIGGSGIKGAIVDTVKGEFVTDRERIPTPQPATPEAVAEVVVQLVEHFDYDGSLGCAFPAVVQRGVVHTAANVDKSWVDTPGQQLFAQKTGLPVSLINDADAAGIAEMRFGAGQDKEGVVVLLTLGTGIGSATFNDGVLVPNTEFGHMYLDNGKKAELHAAERIRDEEELSWEEWAQRVDDVLIHLDRILSPDLYIIGGGVSKHYEHYVPLLTTQVRVVPAELRNRAGIVGAALNAPGVRGSG